MSLAEWRKRTEQLRRIPLPLVLSAWGAQRDHQDKCKWHTTHGTLSVTCAKFFNWHSGRGGGGALDLVIELEHCDFRQARAWLEHHFPGDLPQTLSLGEDLTGQPAALRPTQAAFELPVADPSKFTRIKTYLSGQRALDLAMIEELIASGVLYADAYANAVFVLLGKEGQAIGAELRSSGRAWRGLAPGTHKDLGYFAVPTTARTKADQRPIILCESAIDAISCLHLYPGCHCVSTAGARAHPRWIDSFLEQGRTIYCGYDSDATGERMAQAMITLHPVIKRLRPSAHDWNAALCAKS